jgi:hypothetical protein
MASFDLRKKVIRPSDPQHTRHLAYQKMAARQATRRMFLRTAWLGVFFVCGLFLTGGAFVQAETAYGARVYTDLSEIQKIRVQSLARGVQLPVTELDPKAELLTQYLAQKNSPLAEYAGLISRLPNWRLLVGIANAESGLCKNTDKNNCWGIGPGKPFAYDDISESLYHANYLLSRFDSMGMKKPETLVRTYVGYYNPNWIEAIHDVFYELQQKGLQ